MKKIKKYLKKLEKEASNKFGLKKFKYKTSFELSSSKTLAYFLYDGYKRYFIFNKTVYKKSSFSDFKEIILHEFAHYIVHLKYDYYTSSHGKEWKYVMNQLGVSNPKATSSNFSNIKKRSSDVKVKCGCNSFYISSNKATRMKNGAEYLCKICYKKIKNIEAYK